MTTWISTVGWSPFAVINPIWAYCKEYEDSLNKIILLYTPYERIIKNLEICKKYIIEILKAYNDKDLNDNSIIEEEIKNDSIEIYADKLSRIIKREKKLKPNKIILDMTPGRKYMSAINVYYGFNLAEIPIQVFYLHLEEIKYQDVPYPLNPIIKNELIDILESTEVFSKDFEKISEIKGYKDEEEKLGVNILNKIKEEDKKKDYLILQSINKSFNTKTKIRKFTFGNDIIIRGHELDKNLKSLITNGYIIIQSITKNNQKYNSYDLIKKGKDFLIELEEQYFNEKQEGD